MCGAIASIGSLLLQLARISSIVYVVLAIALLLSGFRALWRGGEHTCHADERSIRNLGSAFLFGAGTSMAISPCCTPVLIGFGALSGVSLSAAGVAGLVAAYTAGHVAPVLLAYAGAHSIQSTVFQYRDATATIAAAVTIALGLYYAVLA